MKTRMCVPSTSDDIRRLSKFEYLTVIFLDGVLELERRIHRSELIRLNQQGKILAVSEPIPERSPVS